VEQADAAQFLAWARGRPPRPPDGVGAQNQKLDLAGPDSFSPLTQTNSNRSWSMSPWPLQEEPEGISPSMYDGGFFEGQESVGATGWD
jgi:hypothetical protein